MATVENTPVREMPGLTGEGLKRTKARLRKLGRKAFEATGLIKLFGTPENPTKLARVMDFIGAVAESAPATGIISAGRGLTSPMYARRLAPPNVILDNLKSGYVIGPSAHIQKVSQNTADLRYGHGFGELILKPKAALPSVGRRQVVFTGDGGTALYTDFVLEDGRTYAGDRNAVRLMEHDVGKARENGINFVETKDPRRLRTLLKTDDEVVGDRFPKLEAKGYGQYPVGDYVDSIVLDAKHIPTKEVMQIMEEAEKRGIPVRLHNGSESVHDTLIRDTVPRWADKGGNARGESRSSAVPNGHNPALDGYSGPRIVINPTTFRNEKDGLCVAWNEALRVAMEAMGYEPTSEPTDAQRRFFADTPYADDELQLRRTILARICVFDTSIS